MSAHVDGRIVVGTWIVQVGSGHSVQTPAHPLFGAAHAHRDLSFTHRLERVLCAHLVATVCGMFDHLLLAVSSAFSHLPLIQ